MTTVSNVTVNVDVSDEVIELIASLQARVDSLEIKSKTPFEEARNSGKLEEFFCEAIKSSILVNPERFQIKFDTTIDGKPYASGVGLSPDDYCGCSEFCNPEPQPFVVIDGTTYISSALLDKSNLDWYIHDKDEPEGLEIKSANYVEGKSGWILSEDGVLHIYSGNEKINFYQDGSHNKSTRDLFERYDENNTCRARFGQLEL